MTAGWLYLPISPARVQGRGLAEDNFAQESRSSLEILIREAIQNPLDARDGDAGHPVRVVLRLLNKTQIDTSFLHSLIDNDYVKRLDASTGELSNLDFDTATVLVLEDFGTTGLLGVFNDTTVDGNRENWNAFWLREGEGAKPGPGSNGRAGQGKITYYRTSAARSVFGLTIRSTDRTRLLMGRSSLRRMYVSNGVKYERDAFWCVQGESETPLPEQQESELNAFSAAFGLLRKTEPGLSLVVPFPIEFNNAEAITTVVSEFYYPIAKGRLEVAIGETEITASNIDDIANEYFPDVTVHQKGSAFTREYRSFIRGIVAQEAISTAPLIINVGWEKATSLSDKHFPEGTPTILRTALEKGDRVSVRFPLTVRPKKEPPVDTWFDVHLQTPEELERIEEAYIRRDLLIGSERHLSAMPYLQKSRGLTLIEHSPLSAFLADAEEPTHLKWNASRPRLLEDYLGPKEIVKATRHAMPKLLAFLSGGLVKRDVRALAKYFTKPSETGSKHSPGGQAGKKNTQPVEPPPPPKRKPFRIVTGADWVRVLPNGNMRPDTSTLPMLCTLEVAYEGLDQDAFREYDPFDFDLSDTKLFVLDSDGMEVTLRDKNRLEFEIQNPNFSLEVRGFDSNIRLRTRLTFMERNDGTTISAE